jgi:hypothetical protein
LQALQRHDYCGASISASSGKLKTRPACLSCIVASSLDPAGMYERVVCSVCRGAGLVHVPASQQAHQAPGWLLISVWVLMSVSLTFFGVTAYFTWREQTKYQGVTEQTRERSHKASRESAEAMLQRIHINMPAESVQMIAGPPDKIEVMSNGDSTIELWDFQCGNDHIRMSIQDGKVQSIRQ